MGGPPIRISLPKLRGASSMVTEALNELLVLRQFCGAYNSKYAVSFHERN